MSAVLAQTALYIVCGRVCQFASAHAAWAANSNRQRKGGRKEVTVCSNRGHVINVIVLRLRSNNEPLSKLKLL